MQIQHYYITFLSPMNDYRPGKMDAYITPNLIDVVVKHSTSIKDSVGLVSIHKQMGEKVED